MNHTPPPPNHTAQLQDHEDRLQEIEYDLHNRPDSVETIKELSRGSLEGTANLLHELALTKHDVATLFSKVTQNTQKLTDSEHIMENLGKATSATLQSLTISKDSINTLIDRVKNLIDRDGDKKITTNDLKLWAIIILQSLLIGFVLSLYWNAGLIWGMLNGTAGMDWNALIKQVILSALVFSWKASQKTSNTKITNLKNIILELNNIIDTLKEAASQNDTKLNDIIKKYENQLFLYEVDLVGKTKASQTKDEIARALMAKYPDLKPIFEKEKLLPAISKEELAA